MAAEKKRRCSNVGTGYYKLVLEGDELEEEITGAELQICSDELPHGVYEVERLVEKRKRKVRFYV